MAYSIPTQWHSLQVPAPELRLDTTLKCGQSFRWVQTADDEWTTVLGRRLITLKQLDDDVHFRTYDVPANTDYEADVRKSLRDYFQLDISLSELYKRWCQDKNFERKAANLTGIRMLRQDPAETLLTFICTSNNNIPRITSMISSLCTHYGTYIGTVPSLSSNPFSFFTFPSISSLASSPTLESHLRHLGFGYRAKYIHATCHSIQKQAKGDGYNDGSEEEWVESLKSKGYGEVREVLLGFTGVGPKVADCICLMGFGFLEVVPVDTHVWQIAKRDYGIKGLPDTKTLTAKHYEVVGRKFREVFGEMAGWAHSVLFTADLKQFESRVTVMKTTKKEVVVSANEGNKRVVKVEDEVMIEQLVEGARKRRKIEMLSEIVVKEEMKREEGKGVGTLGLLRRVKLDRKAKRKA